MSSKQLSALMRKAPPATISDDELDSIEITPEPVRANPAVTKKKPLEPEVPIQVKVPRGIQKKLYHLSVEEGVSLRTLILRGIQSLGIDVPKDELNSRRRKLS
jgi:hypothetical protein